MQKLDIQQLGTILNGLAEIFSKTPVSARGLEFWFETLREFHAEQVFSLLNSWPKQHGKFPVPAEVWKILNERALDDREQRQRSEKAQRQSEYENMKVTPEGKRCLKLIYDMLAGKPKPTPLEHWRKVMETPGLSIISYEHAKIALQRLERREKAAA